MEPWRATPPVHPRPSRAWAPRRLVPCTALVPAVWARARPLRAGSILGILQPSEEIDLDLDEAQKRALKEVEKRPRTGVLRKISRRRRRRDGSDG